MPRLGGLSRLKGVMTFSALPFLFLPLLALDTESIRQSLRKEMAAQSIPGAFAVVIENNKVILAEGFGVTSVSDPQPVTARTLFRLGSTSKIFTALAALRLSADGKLDLHAPVRIPGPFANVTLHQLLTHTAGIADDAPQDGPHDEAALQRNVAGWDAGYRLTDPGRIFSYSNPGYVMAGAVLEKIAAQPFAAVVSRLVFEPLGMTSTTYRPFEAMLSPLALPHSPDGKLIRPFPDHAGAWPPGSVFTNAMDASKFLLRPLPPEITKEYVRIVGDGRGYGYGILLTPGRQFHTGARSGYGSRFEIYPERGVAIFLAGNRSGALFSGTAEIVRRQLGIADAAATLKPLAVPFEEAARVVGVYTNRGPMRVELSMRNQKLEAHLGGRVFPVLRLEDDLYHAPGGAQLERFRIVRASTGRSEFLCAEAWCLRRD